WRVAALALVGAVFVAGLLVTLVMAPVWIVAAVRGRLAARGGAAVRFLPLGALAAVAVTFVLPILAVTSPGVTATHRLASPGPYALAVFLGSLLFPVLAALGVRAAIRSREARPFVRLYAALTCAAVLALAAYSAAIGWIGIRTWTM